MLSVVAMLNIIMLIVIILVNLSCVLILNVVILNVVALLVHVIGNLHNLRCFNILNKLDRFMVKKIVVPG